MFTSSHRTYQTHPAHISTDNIDLPCDVQFKRSWMKKSQPPFWNGSPTGLQSVLTLNTKEKEACHVWHDELKVWSWPGAPARRLAQKRPGNKQSLKLLTDTQRAQTSPTHQTGVSPSWHEWHPGLPQKQRCKLMKVIRSFFFFWSEKTSTSSLWHYFLSLSFFACDSTCNLLEAFPRRVSRKVYLSELKLTTAVKIWKTWSVL